MNSTIIRWFCRCIPPSQFGNKVWIADLHKYYVSQTKEISLEEFKFGLWQLHQSREISLSRCDLISQVEDRSLLERSEYRPTEYATYHFVRLD